MFVSRAVITILLYVLSFTLAYTHYPVYSELINVLDSKQNTWKAENTWKDETLEQSLNALLMKELPMVEHDPKHIAALPESFDAREKWPNCPSINEIRDQGACGDGGLLAAASVMTDRYCIHSNGTKHFHFSSEDLLTCCTMCGIGCRITSSLITWNYWRHTGIVSGGSYNSNQGCKPYTIPPCKNFNITHFTAPCGPLVSHINDCQKSCRPGYNVDYEKDKRFAKRVYAITGEDNIKAEVFLNGPIVTSVIAFTDFYDYKDGIYVRKSDESLTVQDMKILGWGVENGTKYWLLANSWKTGWGQNGFCKFLRGTNHCNVEWKTQAGEPIIV